MSAWTTSRILVTGASGFLGRHVMESLVAAGYEDVVGAGRGDGDLCDPVQVRGLLQRVRPRAVINMAGLVGGILPNRNRPAEFFHDNLMIGTLVLHESWRAGVEKLIAPVGGCSYPHDAPNPIVEEAFFDGVPQAESAPYAQAKRMALVQAQAYRRQHGFNAVVLLIGNAYGPYDDFDLEESHVVASLIRKFAEAAAAGRDQVTLWGSGRPVRDFIYARDAAGALVRALETYDQPDLINVSSGIPTSICRLAGVVAQVAGFSGEVRWDASMPDGQMEKIYEVRRMREVLRFTPATSLEEGLRLTHRWFLDHMAGAPNAEFRVRNAE